MTYSSQPQLYTKYWDFGGAISPNACGTNKHALCERRQVNKKFYELKNRPYRDCIKRKETR